MALLFRWLLRLAAALILLSVVAAGLVYFLASQSLPEYDNAIALPGPSAPHCLVALRGEALATSGDLINSYVLAGHRYSHIIDPRRMAPSDSALASVSVLAPQAITADALATALFAMGPESGPAFAEQAGIVALFLSRDGTGLREVMTGRFADRIVLG